jgi:hypothetical protein
MSVAFADVLRTFDRKMDAHVGAGLSLPSNARGEPNG